LAFPDGTEIKTLSVQTILKIPRKEVFRKGKVGSGVPRLHESAHPNQSDYGAKFQEIPAFKASVHV
jgi:hypothetical protein